MQNFLKNYKTIETDKKLNFLEQLLQKDSYLQKQFLQFIKKEDLDEIAVVDIDNLTKEMCDKISSIDTTDIVEGSEYYCQYDSYYNDDEIYPNDILEDILDLYFSESAEYLQKGNMIDAFRVLLAIYELTIVPMPDIEDDYCIFDGGLEDYISDVALDYCDKFSENIKAIVLSYDSKKALIDLLMHRYFLSEESYHLSAFESILETLIDQKDIANYLFSLIEKYSLYTGDTSLILLNIAEVIKDDELFLRTANSFAMLKGVALKLLEKYKNINDEVEFARVAKTLLESDDYYAYSEYIAKHINKVTYEELYIKALKIEISKFFYDYKPRLDYYKLLRDYLSIDKRLKFIENFRKEDIFYISLLNVENQHEKILNFVQKLEHAYNLKELVVPIITIYPDEVFEMIKKQSDKLVNARGRKSYQEACELLKLMQNVKEKKDELKIYVNKLYNHQPRLPALRDELVRAKLMKG